MATLVGSAQCTVVDQRDPGALTCALTGSAAFQQTYDQAASPQYVPNRDTGSGGSALTITPKVVKASIGGAVDVTSQLTGIKWGTTFGASDLATTPTYAIANNTFVMFNSSPPSKMIYFEATYTDPVTGVAQTAYAQVNISVVVTGTNATYSQIDGTTQMMSSPDVDFVSYVNVYCNMIRQSGVDDTNVVYRWWVGPNFALADMLDANHALVVSGGIMFKSTAQIAANQWTPAYSVTAPTDGAATGIDVKGLLIKEPAVLGTLILKCEAKDTVSGEVTYAYATITDPNDAYQINVEASAGTTLKNGTGSTYLFPRVSNKNVQIKDFIGWKFDWYQYNSDGSRGAPVTGATYPVTANTTTTLTATGAAGSAGGVVKAVKGTVVKYFEIASVSGGIITVKTSAHTKAWLSNYTLTAGEFVSGSVHICTDFISAIPAVTGTQYSCLGTNAYNTATRALTCTASLTLAAGDVVRVKPATVTEANANLTNFYEVESVAGAVVTLKANGFVSGIVNAERYPLPISSNAVDSFKLQKVDATKYPGLLVDGADVDSKASFVVSASKP